MSDKATFDKSEFVGVFYFTNWTDEDYVHLWNNEEYTFPKLSSVPLIMPKEPAESIQEIRKRFAFDLAVREFYTGKEYKRMAKMGNGLPPTYDEKILEPMIEKCLNPLPLTRARVRSVEDGDIESKLKASKAIGKDENVNFAFKDDNVEGKIKVLGKMNDKVSVN